MAVERISQPAVSPDGRFVAFVVSRPDPKENKTRHCIRLLDLATRETRELTPGPGNHQQPAWSPDGQWIAFVSDRDDKLGSQLWVLPFGPGEARRITSGYGGADHPRWAPDSRRIALARKVVVSPDYKPDKSESADPKSGPPRARVYGLINEKSSARVENELLFRHWDEWRERRRRHLFLADIVTGRVEDLTPFDCDVPPIALGSEVDYDFRPDGCEIAYVMNPNAVVARSTNNSIFLQKLRGVQADGAPACISDSEACDNSPRWTPDGRHLLYLAMEVPGFEADRQRIKLYNRESGKTRVLLADFDRSLSAFEIAGAVPRNLAFHHVSSRTSDAHRAGKAGRAADGGEVVFIAQDRGRQSIYRLDLATGDVRQLTEGTYNGLVRLIPNRDELLVTRESTTEPADLYLLRPGSGIAPILKLGPRAAGATPADAGATTERLTRTGDVLSAVEMNPAEEFWYSGAGGHPIQGFLIRPPGFRAGRKIPLILLIHGGPQSAFLDHFHYRWNYQLFASSGAAVAFLNPRGSTGYGQTFTDQISRDWGGRCYRDLMLGLDHLLERFSFLDGRKVAAAGASFGGFMINWIAGHTDRFQALVCHDGIFQAETMAYTTEELWFDEHDYGGLPYEKGSEHRRWSPHLFVRNFRTPTLVIHGEQDFRCPISEGIGMFTALQIQGVPSRLLVFPDEGHWVLSPANAEVWYHEVLKWLMEHLEAQVHGR